LLAVLVNLTVIVCPEVLFEKVNVVLAPRVFVKSEPVDQSISVLEMAWVAIVCWAIVAVPVRSLKAGWAQVRFPLAAIVVAN
jgi:hypothetical protein